MLKVKQNVKSSSNVEQLRKVKQFVKQTVKQSEKEQAQAPLKNSSKNIKLYIGGSA